ncbi:MAG TPA: hypothetical protein VGG19_07445, partial [Tepidisphaeraceae bacterium]
RPIRGRWSSGSTAGAAGGLIEVSTDGASVFGKGSRGSVSSTIISLSWHVIWRQIRLEGSIAIK